MAARKILGVATKKKPCRSASPPFNSRTRFFFCPETRQLAVLPAPHTAILHPHPTHTHPRCAPLRPSTRQAEAAPARPLDSRGACRTRGSARSARKQGPRPAPEVAARGRGWRAQCPRAAIDFPLMASMMGAACPLHGALRLGGCTFRFVCTLVPGRACQRAIICVSPCGCGR